jgi:uncharacterized protein
MIPVLGARGAAALARRMLDHAVAKAIEADLGPVELCVSPLAHSIWARLNIPTDVCVTDQGDGDLGARMARACARTLAAGESVLLIGTDCPACDASYLRAMALAMDNNEAVIAAASDGGYPAIGLTRYAASVFEDIAWSTNTVLHETIVKFHALAWRFEVFPELNDIDDPGDLIHLPPGWLP